MIRSYPNFIRLACGLTFAVPVGFALALAAMLGALAMDPF
jgi:hypothetical protein